MANTTKNANTKAALTKCYYAAREYCESVLKEEEYLNTFKKVWKDCCRVSAPYGKRRLDAVSVEQVENYLKGLSISVDFYCCDTKKHVCEWLGVKESEVTGDTDALYWRAIAFVFHDGALCRWGKAFDKAQEESKE